MSDRRFSGVPIAALLLIAAGVVLLLQNMGIVRWELWLEIWRFWPLVLVAIGVSLVFGRRLRWLSSLILAALIVGAFTGAALMAEDSRELVVERISEPLGGAHKRSGPHSRIPHPRPGAGHVPSPAVPARRRSPPESFRSGRG